MSLDAKFGRERVLGGLCAIAVTLNEKREVIHLQPLQSLTFGERDGKPSDRVRAIAEVMAKGNFGSKTSGEIIQEMWEKWVFLASLAASTCLMRTSVGNILASPGGKDFVLGMLDECSAVAAAEGHAPRAAFLERIRGMLTAEGSPMTASMFRDIKAGAPVEADHVIGDLVARADAAKVPVPKLRTAYTHLKAYESSGGSCLMVRSAPLGARPRTIRDRRFRSFEHAHQSAFASSDCAGPYDYKCAR